MRVRVCAARRALVAGRKQALLVQVHESVLLLIRGRASVVVVGGVNTQVLAEWGQCVYSRRRRGACHLDLRRGRSRAHRPWGRGLKLISPLSSAETTRGRTVRVELLHAPREAPQCWRIVEEPPPVASLVPEQQQL